MTAITYFDNWVATANNFIRLARASTWNGARRRNAFSSLTATERARARAMQANNKSNGLLNLEDWLAKRMFFSRIRRLPTIAAQRGIEYCCTTHGPRHPRARAR
eukprot:1090660-Pyramimonas_sp.AAC.1